MSEKQTIIDNRPLRVVVCGTTFGRVYMEAVRRTHPRLILAGVVARGSDQSRECAASFGVPLYTSVSDLPDDIDIACVVVRSGVVGGAGARLCDSLIARGIHVIQEQPAHHDEVANCLRNAHKAGVHYQLNPFYRSVAPIREMLDRAARLRELTPIHFVEATCAIQVLYPMLDMLGKALGGLRPWNFAEVATLPSRGAAGVSPFPYTTIEATVSGTPVTIRVQNELDPTDPDNHAYCLLRTTLGTERGTLTLSDTLGPLLWHPRLHVPKGADGAHAIDQDVAAHLELPTFSVIGSETGDSFHNALSQTWPDGVAYTLNRFADVIQGKAERLSDSQYTLAVCGIWQDLARQLGDPRLVDHPHEPQPLSVEAILGEETPAFTAPIREVVASSANNINSEKRTDNAASNWLRCYRKVDNPRMRLFCLPHAGGSASFFREWANLMPADIEVLVVQYPGREERLEETLITSMEPLVEGLLGAIIPLCDRPFAIFGHSMGASVGYEVSGRLAEMGMPSPAHLFVSGQWAPADHKQGDLYLSDDAALCSELSRVGGAGPWMEEPELRALMLPIVRGDFQLIETYQPNSWLLTCPVTALGGVDDPDVDEQDLQRWSTVNKGEFSTRIFQGDHFYLSEYRAELLNELKEKISQRQISVAAQKNVSAQTQSRESVNPQNKTIKNKEVKNDIPSPQTEVDMMDPYALSAEFYDIMAASQWQTAGPMVAEALANADPTNGPILEVGAGTGLSTKVIADAVPGAEIIAVEPSPAMRSALTSRLMTDPDLAKRVTVESEGIAEIDLPDRLCAAIVVGVVGYIEPEDRIELWNTLAQRLPQGAPVIVDVMALPKPMKVPPMSIARATIGANEYRVSISGEPADKEGCQHWTMGYEILRQGQKIRSFETEHVWQTFSIDEVIDEISPAGFEGTKITPHMAVLTRI